MALEDRLYPLLKIYHKIPFGLKRLLGLMYKLIPSTIKYGKFYKTYYNRIKWYEQLNKSQTLIETEKTIIA